MNQSVWKTRVPLLVAVIVAGTLCSAVAVEPPDFGGSWKRNPELSQDWEAQLDAAIRPEADRNEPRQVAFIQRLRELLRGAADVRIRQSDDEIQIESGLDEVRIFYLGREHMRENKTGLRIRATSRWLEDDLIVEEATEDGSVIVERLILLGRGEQLAHILRWEHKDLIRPLILRSVYDRQ